MTPTSCPGSVGLYSSCAPTPSLHAVVNDLGSAWLVVVVIIVTLGLIAFAVWAAAQHG